MRLPTRLSLAASLLGLLWLAPTGNVTAAAEEPASSTDNVRHVANLAYEERYGQDLPFGTDIELRAFGNKRYAFAGTFTNGLQIIDVTKPAAPKVAAVYDCALAQGDVQLFTQGRRVLATFAADDGYEDEADVTSRCYRENGLTEVKPGTFFIDITNPKAPTTAGFVELPRGSHNQSVHPSGQWMYNSNADLGGVGVPSIEVVDIRDLKRPVVLPEPLVLGTGLDSHDITFSADGTRAYSAALTHTLVIDSSDPGNPSIIGRILDPTINIHHQADPVTIGDKTFLIVTDELAGAAGNGFCPGGGLHVYDITGPLEAAPLKVGFFVIPEAGLTTGSSITCTSHVLKIHPAEQLMTIAWYAAGTRIIDLAGLADPIPTMTEVGHAYFDDSDTWAAKALTVTRDGTFHVFANDMNRGLDVFEVTLSDEAAAPVLPVGTWRTPDQLVPVATGSGDARAPYCVLRAAA